MTEKDYNPEQNGTEGKNEKKMKAAEKVATPKPVAKEKVEAPKTETKAEEKPVETKTENQETKQEDKKTENKPRAEGKKQETKKPEQKPKEKKEFAIVNVSNLPISTKKSRDFCNFVRGKKIESAIKELEKVKLKKIAVPAKGEVSHQKGKGMTGGIYSTKTAEHFLVLLKSLLANANNNGLENPIVAEAIANIGQRPYGRFGRMRKKRTHIKLVAREFKGTGRKRKNKQKTKENKK